MPEIVITAPGVMKVPATEKPVGFGETIGDIAGIETGINGMVLVPMTRPDEPSETNVPETVTPCPPRKIVVPAIEKAVGSEPTGLGGS